MRIYKISQTVNKIQWIVSDFDTDDNGNELPTEYTSGDGKYTICPISYTDNEKPDEWALSIGNNFVKNDRGKVMRFDTAKQAKDKAHLLENPHLVPKKEPPTPIPVTLEDWQNILNKEPRPYMKDFIRGKAREKGFEI
jgi:hypothetical protein